MTQESFTQKQLTFHLLAWQLHGNNNCQLPIDEAQYDMSSQEILLSAALN